MKTFCFLTCLLGIIAFAQSEIQTDTLHSEYGELKVLQDYHEPQTKSGHIPLGIIDRIADDYFGFKKGLGEKSGFNYIVEYAPIFQWDFGGIAGSHLNDEINLIGQWAAIGPNEPSPGSLIAWYQISRTLGSRTTSQFMEELGIATPVNGGDTAPAKSKGRFVHFAWEQHLWKQKIRIMAGKLSTRVFLNLNRYGVSDREDFINFMFVNNPVVPFIARQGLGIFAQYQADDWYFSSMFRDATASSDFIDLESLKDGSWEYAAEIALTPANFAGLGEGNYRFTFHYTDSTGAGLQHSSGWTASFSFDQDFGRLLGMMFRYAYASENFLAFKQRLAFGAQLLTPFQFENDRIGIGFWWGGPVNNQLNNEYGLEAYWKFQFARFLELTPDLQVVLNPAKNEERSAIIIGGVRLRAVL